MPFKPFLRHLPDPGSLSRPDLALRHRSNNFSGFWAARSSANCRWTATSGNSPSSNESLAICDIDDEGGPLLSHGEPEAEQRAFISDAHDMPKVLPPPLPGRCREPEAAAPRKTIWNFTGDEPSEPLTAPMQTAHRPRGSRVKPRSRAAGAPQGAGLDGEPRGRGSQLAVPTGAEDRQPDPPYTVAPHHQDAGDLIDPQSPTNSAREPNYWTMVSPVPWYQSLPPASQYRPPAQ